MGAILQANVSKARFANASAAVSWVEKAVVLGFFSLFVSRMGSQLYEATAATALYPELIKGVLVQYACLVLLAVSELLAVILILRQQRAHAVLLAPIDGILTFAAITLPFLAVSGETTGSSGPWIMAAGLSIQIWAKVALNWSYGLLPANRGIKTSGPYRFVRHPMYTGYSLTHLGYLAAFPSGRNAALYVLIFILQVFRALREERLLSETAIYLVYCSQVRSRFVPHVL